MQLYTLSRVVRVEVGWGGECLSFYISSWQTRSLNTRTEAWLNRQVPSALAMNRWKISGRVIGGAGKGETGQRRVS